MAISIKSIVLNILRSLCVRESKIMEAAPVDKPEVKNNGPKMALFHKGLALKADNKIPV